MDQFSAAYAKNEKRMERVQRQAGKQSGIMGGAFLQPEKHTQTLHLPSKQKPPKTNGRHNEIDVTIYVNGRPYTSSFKTDIAGSTIASKITDDGFRAMLAELFETKFGRTKAL